MTVKIVSLFNKETQAQKAVMTLRKQGIDLGISFLSLKRTPEQEDHTQAMTTDTSIYTETTDSLTNGSGAGSIIGGLAGLAAGTGALVIPGIGPLLAAGPMAGILTGVISGGVAGGLIDWGIPAGESRRHEENIKQGKVLISVECKSDEAEKVMDILRQQEAVEVKKY